MLLFFHYHLLALLIILKPGNQILNFLQFEAIAITQTDSLANDTFVFFEHLFIILVIVWIVSCFCCCNVESHILFVFIYVICGDRPPQQTAYYEGDYHIFAHA